MAQIGVDRLSAAFQPDHGRARRGVVLANGPAVQGVAEYRAFEWPRGSGETWRLAPLGFVPGARLAELEIEQMDIAAEFQTARDRADGAAPDRAVLADLTRRWVDWGAQAVAFMGPLMIPTWPLRRRWGYRMLRRFRMLRFRRNPLQDAPQNDLAELLGFFSQCRTNSGRGIRPVADTA